MLKALQNDLEKLANPEKAVFLKRFFKTGKGEYVEGDIFLGIVVPDSRKIAVKYKDLSLAEIEKLLQSPVHEERLIALLILILQYKKADAAKKKELYEFYLSHTKYINNWDLVDTSADKIVGEYLWELQLIHPQLANKVLETLAHSESIWDRRIAILSTFAFIRHNDASKTFAIADILLNDKHDLIHKAVGWLLREVGKKISPEVEEKFLSIRYTKMPRTMLRYSLEHFSSEKRKQYLTGTIDV